MLCYTRQGIYNNNIILSLLLHCYECSDNLLTQLRKYIIQLKTLKHIVYVIEYNTI